MSFQAFAKEAKKDYQFFMLIGNGSKKQFKRFRTEIIPLLETKIVPAMKQAQKPALLYFGDAPNPQKPDIGMAFQHFAEHHPDIPIFMIQIKKAEAWGIPPFVRAAYFHRNYREECMWGGLDAEGKPCSNTKQWLKFHKTISPILKIFVLGGGPITKDEVMLAKQAGIPVVKYEVTPKY